MKKILIHTVSLSLAVIMGLTIFHYTPKEAKTLAFLICVLIGILANMIARILTDDFEV